MTGEYNQRCDKQCQLRQRAAAAVICTEIKSSRLKPLPLGAYFVVGGALAAMLFAAIHAVTEPAPAATV
jgi:hypothetical protein